MSEIIGRKDEVKELNDLYLSGRPEFVAIYGRRRVGKTFLVDKVFKNKITFRHSGLSPVDEEGKANNLQQQLQSFYQSLLLQGVKKTHCPKNWLEAFFMLEMHLQKIDDGSRQVVFLDELPWMDTPRSRFITALESFWNGWACHRDNVMLVVCGSANSWMLDNLVNNHGGLYGRTTHEIKLLPFSLAECGMFFKKKGVRLSHYDIAQSNMIVGGIPYYMDYFEKDKSLAQNVDNLFFARDAKLKNEFQRLFSSVFARPEDMMKIVRFLSTRRCGYSRDSIIEHLQINDNGEVTKWLRALISSDFIDKYVPFGESKRTVFYKLIDPFCLFYLRFVDGQNGLNPDFWTNNVLSPKMNAWRGFAFEDLCLRHIEQVKRALQIAGVTTSQSSWAVAGDDEQEGSQIDLLILRKDNVVNMCEMKFYSDDFAVDKSFHRKMVRRTIQLQDHLGRKNIVHSTLITTYGLTYNEYSGDFVSVITLDDLFA